MKKQILILSFIFVASIISISNASGQALPGSSPRGIGCTDDALHPIAGKPYTYEVTANPTGGDFTWWVTKDANFIQTDGSGVRSYNNATDALAVDPSELLGTSANYNVSTTDGNTVEITWSDAILSNTAYQTNPTFVAVYYNNSAVGCADNLKVYEIAPVNAFTVDILNYDHTNLSAPLAYDATDSQCIADVSSATYSGGAMQYLYGENVLVYEVVAANFTSSYTPTFAVSGLNPVQTYALEWTYDPPATWNASTVFTDYVANPTTAVTTTETNTSAGVSIYVRLTITNNNFEGLSALPVTLAVDGQNSIGEWDVDNGDGTICNVTTAADQADTAIQTIEARPTITPVTSSTIAPTTIVPGDEQN